MKLFGFNALTAVGALMALKDLTLSNARRFYSSMGNPLAVKGLKTSKMSPCIKLVIGLLTLSEVYYGNSLQRAN